MYANTFCAHNPHHATDLIGYLFLIASAVREYSLPAVVAYDVAFRRKVSTFKAIPWGQIDPALYTGPGKGKPHATCMSCLQAGHDQSDCPFYTDGGQPRKCGARWLAREHPSPSAAPGRCVETSTEDDAQGTTAAACMYAQSGDVLAPTHRSVVPSSVPPQGNSEAVSYPPTCTPVTTHSTRTRTRTSVLQYAAPFHLHTHHTLTHILPPYLMHPLPAYLSLPYPPHL